MRYGLCAILSLSLLWVASNQRPARGDEQVEFGAKQQEFYSTQIRPLLKTKCLGCHGDGDKIESNFDMRSRAAVIRGGDIGPGAVPGKAAESAIYKAVLRDGDVIMPPKDRNRLDVLQIDALRRWIDMGLPWAEEAADVPTPIGRDQWDAERGVLVRTSGGLDASWTNRRYKPEDIWAFQPLRQVEIPKVKVDNAVVEHPVDAFILRKFQEKDLKPAPPADPRTWLRRATFDLTGLPPTAEEIAEFGLRIADWKKQHPDQSAIRIPQSAINAGVDRLLGSPHYGERMAQHWLDVVRYADSGGFSNDWERPHAWRYRDYVIRSFNEDKPYNWFVIEQLAGDELDPRDPEMKIAVGFLRMGPWEHTAMSVAAVTRQQYLDDVTNNVGLTFLGQGMSCCQCHDHKFDPLPTRDYYRLQAVFASTEFHSPVTPLLADERVPDAQRRKRELKQIVDAKDWIETEDPGNDSRRRVGKKRDKYMALAAKRFDPLAFSVQHRGNPTVNILAGGSLERPGDVVTPGVLSAVRFAGGEHTSGEVRHGWDITKAAGGRRLELAKWIADKRNPLTSRVIVNRVWQMHFGTGLVATPNSFGKMGAKPTHPELLDWLAGWFVKNGWSIKKLHRLIMTSRTYQRSSQHGDMAALTKADPKNQLLAYFPPRRLTAEEIRDAMLSVTGELNPAMGGPGVYPEINWEVALQPRHIMGAIAPAYQPSPVKKDRDRRSIYAQRIRTLANPMLEVLNRPGPDVSCARRDETTVSPQAFAMFNSEAAHARALALARRLEEMSDTTDDRIQSAFQLVYGRAPSKDELAASEAHVEQMTAHHREHPPVRRELPQVVAREMIDEQTGKPFRWKEKLHWLADYERDLMPWEVKAETRALAELCLVLMNSNEFVYVY